MAKIDFRQDIRCLQPIHVLCKGLAVLPGFDINDMQTCRPQYFFGIVMIVVYTISEAFAIHGKITHLENVLYVTVYLTLIATDFILLAGNIGAILTGNLCRGKAIGVFLSHLMKIDLCFKGVECRKSRIISYMFYVELVASHVCFAIYIVLNLYTWEKLTGHYMYFLARDFQNYQFIVFSLLTRYWALALHYRFEMLNSVLWQFRNKMQFCDAKTSSVYNCWSMKRISRVYTKLTWMVEEFNSIFGFQFVLFYINILFNLLLPINMALVYGSGQREIAGVNLGAELIVLCVIWAAFPMIMGIGMFSACDKGANEAEKTAMICYDILHCLPASGNFKEARTEIVELAAQVSNKAPKFTAAGFFTVNTAALFALFGAVTSYLIVLIQFNK